MDKMVAVLTRILYGLTGAFFFLGFVLVALIITNNDIPWFLFIPPAVGFILGFIWGQEGLGYIMKYMFPPRP